MDCARCENRPIIRTDAITASGPFRSGLPRFSVLMEWHRYGTYRVHGARKCLIIKVSLVKRV
jgi:hypothetical protein